MNPVEKCVTNAHIIQHYPGTKNIWYEQYMLNGLLHREDGPADIVYDKNGQKSVERWYLKGILHRFDGPAVITYKNGKLQSEQWVLDNKVVNPTV